MAMPAPSPVPPFQRHLTTLPSGLRVVTVEMPHLHTATVVMYAKVGSRFEDARDNGLSHFLEHMLFRGTARHPDAHTLNYAIEELGGTLYAETGRDYSLYQLSLHPETLDGGIDHFGEIFTTPMFEGIDVERRIILEEILEDLDESGRPINVDDLARAKAFPDHSLGFPITGPYANVERFTVEDVRRHFARCYGAKNMVLCVSGRCDTAKVVARVEQALGQLPSGSALDVTPPAEPKEGAPPEFVYVRNPGSQTSLQLDFRAVSESARDYPALVMLSRILDDGMSTRLHHRLCDELGLAYYVSGGLDAFHDAGLFEIDATCGPGSVLALAEESLRLVGRLREEAPSESELDKAKRRFRWDLEASFDDADAMAGWWGGTELYRRPATYDEKLARMMSVTASDVRDVAARIFRPERLTVAAVGALDKGRDKKLRELVENFR